MDELPPLVTLSANKHFCAADQMRAYAAAAVARERERCAKVCDGFVDTFEANRGYGPEMCAAAIRKDQ